VASLRVFDGRVPLDDSPRDAPPETTGLVSNDAAMTIVALGLAGLAAIGSCWLAGRFARQHRFGAMDHPGNRSLHSTPTPRTGGVAILTALTVTIVIGGSLGWVFERSGLGQSPGLGIVLAATALLAGHSYWSDLREVPVLVRLGVQVTLGIIAVWGARLTLDAVRVPAWETIHLGRLAFPITILALVWMTNLYNFMDGMDGFAGGMTIAGFSALAWFGWHGGQPVIGWLSLLVVGATAGFVVYNFPPARIFMGDVGSVPLGFLAGCLALMQARDALFDIWVPLLVFSPFVVDATVTIVRRIYRREPIWRPHREHYYQRLVIAGWGHRRTVLAEYALMLACGATAILYAQVDERTQLLLLFVWATAYACLIFGVRIIEARGSRAS
jgi:UDP-N-acetylmuramyl pentapeptide phosphotransferase/UDP-N-acetylglucosamine-1-phosphate transferase